MNFTLSGRPEPRVLRGAVPKLACTLLTIIASTLPAVAQSETVLYSFCSQSRCADGRLPGAGVILDAHGNLYGTTMVGGTFDKGVLFKLNSNRTETLLHVFGAGSDGQLPTSDLMMDSAGNIYGTTQAGGAQSMGTVYRVTPGGTETVLYNFCSTGATSCTDGANPLGGVIADAQGNLYGTAYSGGAYGGGTVYKVSPSGGFTVLHSFAGGNDGYYPTHSLLMDSAGNMYGTTAAGGSTRGCSGLFGYGCGTLFTLTGGGTETVLYAFCNDGARKCADGADPESDLSIDKQGNLWGTTVYGGAHRQGVVFFVTPGGHETVVHNFNFNGTDGALPAGSLIMDKAGNIYGTTTGGGTGTAVSGGTLYKIDRQGRETILHDFGLSSSDGSAPSGNLVMDSEGNLYGITGSGGPEYGGTVFKLTP